MISYPFESQNTGTAEAPVYDRAITAEQERYFNKLRYVNGVFNTPANGLQVEAVGGMTIKVNPGGCHIEGAIGYQQEALTLELSAAGTKPRIDRVAARFNTSLSVRNIEIVVLEGVAATSPKAPELTKEPNYYEIALADVYVAASAEAVSNTNITDQRANDDLCGFVVPAIPTPLDLSALYKQYQDSLDKYLGLVASALDDTTAGHLQNQLYTVAVNNVAAVYAGRNNRSSIFTEVYANGRFKVRQTEYDFSIGPLTEKYWPEGSMYAIAAADDLDDFTNGHFFADSNMFDDLGVGVDYDRLSDIKVSVEFNNAGSVALFATSGTIKKADWDDVNALEFLFTPLSASRLDTTITCDLVITIEGYWTGEPNFWTVSDGNEVAY